MNVFKQKSDSQIQGFTVTYILKKKLWNSNLHYVPCLKTWGWWPKYENLKQTLLMLKDFPVNFFENCFTHFHSVCLEGRCWNKPFSNPRASKIGLIGGHYICSKICSKSSKIRKKVRNVVDKKQKSVRFDPQISRKLTMALFAL